MGLSLRNIASKAWDQFNPLDNGRTYQQRTPINTRSVGSQLMHNGTTNTVGNFITKPFVINPAQNIIETGRGIAADFTNNPAAQAAGAHREWENIKASIPGFIGGQIWHAGATLKELPRALQANTMGGSLFPSTRNPYVNDVGFGLSNPVGFMLSKGLHKGPHAPTAEQQKAYNKGLQNLNQTAPGQMVSPVEGLAADRFGSLREPLKAGGYNVDAPGAQKYFSNPAVGTLATIGLAGGGLKLAGELSPTVAETPLPTVSKKIPVDYVESTPAKKVDIRSIPSQDELVSRYNQHMANLAREFGKNAQDSTLGGNKGVISEPSVINDVDYAARKQAIQKAYEDGTLSKPIPVKDAPTISAKETAELEKLKANPNLSKSKQIREAILKEKAGEKPTVTAKPPEGDLTGLEPRSPYDTTPKAPNAFNRAWQSVRGVISQYGEAGSDVSRRLGLKRDISEVGQEKFIKQIPSVLNLGKDEFRGFVQTLERLGSGEKGLSGISPKIQQAVMEWKQAIPTIRDQAVKAGLDVGDLGEYYFPRQYSNLFKSGDALKGMAQQLVDNGTAKNLGEAMDKLKFMRREYTRPFGNLERTREFNLPGYDMNHEALTNYISRSFDRIAHAEQFGPNNEILNQLKTRMAEDGYDINPNSTLDKYLRTAFNDTDKSSTPNKISSVVRQVNAYRSLGSAGISNATQLPVNTSTIAGIGRTIKGVVNMAVSKEARSQARDTGVLLDHSISDISEKQLGAKGAIASNLASPFFRTVERFNRQATAIVGKDFGNSLAKKASNGSEYATRMLDKLGVTGEIGEKLTREQEIQAARGLVEASQFKVDPMDLPGWVDSPLGKVVAQFRTFQYKQTDFMYNYVLKEAFHGNFVPMTRFISTGVPAGLGSMYLRGLMKGNHPLQTNPDQTTEQKALGLAAKGINQVGGTGLIGDSAMSIIDGAKYGNTTGAMAGIVGGPTASLAVETGQNIDKGVRGDWSKLEKEGLRQIPTVGPYASNKLFPSQGAPSTGGNKPTSDLSIEEMNNRSKKEEADFKKSMKPGGSSLTQLSNGKYIYQTGNESHTADDLKSAREAVAKYTFKNSDERKRTVGDKVYYKDSQGDVHTEDKVIYDWNQKDSKTKLELDRAYESGDWTKWTTLYKQEWQALEDKKKFYSPDTEQDKLDDITLQQENLQQKANGYLEKIQKGKGFGAHATSSGGGGGGGSNGKNIASSYAYAVNRNAGVAAASQKPTVTLRRSGGGKVATRRSTAPKVSLKKSRV